ncbi:Serine/threonine-protein kinase AtPK2/AtPK19 [Hibiscus syriacus]|uniref:non-specific serine/threonine protein kinase n=1 Tax=Hibiscus syriacus TaxID=106335 RepID=A0A6A2X2N8_HIBSY|nr:Serine/threonine-protein kinase AtPK2/AtPK19 [Hibiscus syriacus]
MVSSKLSVLAKGCTCKPFDAKLLFAANPPEDVLPDKVELDFSVVLGPPPVQDLIEVSCGEPDTTASAEGVTELVYDEPAIVYSRLHSLLCPSSLVSTPLKLSKLTLSETGDAIDLIECIKEETYNEVEELSDADGDHKMKVSSIGIEDFEVLKVVGQGAFGKVYQVRKKGTHKIYAMKVMRKDKIMEKNHAENMKAERDILTKVDHPFIVQLEYSFQTKYRLYLILDFVNGGHLFFQLHRHGLFREDQARIYAAEIVSAVSHLHANGIMHRDLKPENILLDADGHLILTDFGLAKQFDANKISNSLCGTVEYMAPEIITGKGHDKAADWWSVGALIFEMLTRKVASFYRRKQGKIQQKIVKERMKLPKFLSSEAHSLLKGVFKALVYVSHFLFLLHKDPSKRLGSGPTGSEEIKRCKWLKTINWKKLEAREIQPGFHPEIAGKHCVANFVERWTDMPLTFSPASSP